jgi:hypothetical protein
MAYRAQNPVGLLFYRGNSSGSLAMLLAIRRASAAWLPKLLALQDNFLSRKNKTCQ